MQYISLVLLALSAGVFAADKYPMKVCEDKDGYKITSAKELEALIDCTKIATKILIDVSTEEFDVILPKLNAVKPEPMTITGSKLKKIDFEDLVCMAGNSLIIKDAPNLNKINMPRFAKVNSFHMEKVGDKEKIDLKFDSFGCKDSEQCVKNITMINTAISGFNGFTGKKLDNIDVKDNKLLTSWDFGSLEEINSIEIKNNPALKTATFTKLTTVNGKVVVSDNKELTTLDLSNLAKVEKTLEINNPSITDLKTKKELKLKKEDKLEVGVECKKLREALGKEFTSKCSNGLVLSSSISLVAVVGYLTTLL